MSNREQLAERIAQAALRGWFNDPDGFKDMSRRGPNGKAVRAVLKLLDQMAATHSQPNREPAT